MNLATPKLVQPTWAVEEEYDGPVTVACVLWGTAYSVDYVYKLKAAVAKHLKRPHHFVCISDRQIKGVTVFPIGDNLKGWWHKIKLFRPYQFLHTDRILYLDLDVVITGSLDWVVNMRLEKSLTMIYNFGPNRHHAAHNSSVMLWQSGDPTVERIYNKFFPEVAEKLHGDQCWMWRVLTDDNIQNFPLGHILSYKYDVRGKNLPKDSKVVVFHGEPKPHQCRESWVDKNWVRVTNMG